MSSSYALGTVLVYGGNEEENLVSFPQRSHILIRNITMFITNYNTKQENICVKSNL